MMTNINAQIYHINYRLQTIAFKSPCQFLISLDDSTMLSLTFLVNFNAPCKTHNNDPKFSQLRLLLLPNNKSPTKHHVIAFDIAAIIATLTLSSKPANGEISPTLLTVWGAYVINTCLALLQESLVIRNEWYKVLCCPANQECYRHAHWWIGKGYFWEPILGNVKNMVMRHRFGCGCAVKGDVWWSFL